MRGALLGVSMLAGCLVGSGQSSPTPAPDAVVTAPVAATKAPAAAAVPARVYDRAEVVCERAVRCGGIGRSQLEECRKGPGKSRLTLLWGFDEMLGIPRLVAEGRLTVVPGADQACLAYLASAPCVVDRERAREGCSGWSGPSFTLLAPAVAPGGKCTRWDECVDGYCTAQTACEGVCKAAAKLGEACGAWQVCEEGAFCWEDKCRARAGVGEACGAHWQWCADGLFCEGFVPGSDDHHYPSPPRDGRCSAPKQLGEPCVPPQTTVGEICAGELYCDWGAPAPVCSARRQAGDECRWDSACGDGLTCMGLELGGGVHPSGKMLAVRKAGRCTPVLDAGEACAAGAFVTGCPASMTCDLKTRVCRSTGHVGDPCQSSWMTTPRAADEPLPDIEGCNGGNYCEVATRTCRPQVARGGPCKPQKFGAEDEPCFLGKCDARTRRCVVECKER